VSTVFCCRLQIPHEADARLDHDRACAAVLSIAVGRCFEKIHREANPQGNESRQPHIASGACHQRRLLVPSGFFCTAIECNAACAGGDIRSRSVEHRGELIGPENVEFIAAYGPGEGLLSWHVERRVCWSIGEENPAVIPAPNLHPIFCGPSPPRAIRLPGFYLRCVVELARRRFGDRGGEVCRERLTPTQGYAGFRALAIDNVLPEAVRGDKGNRAQQDQRLENVHRSLRRTGAFLIAEGGSGGTIAGYLRSSNSGSNIECLLARNLSSTTPDELARCARRVLNKSR